MTKLLVLDAGHGEDTYRTTGSKGVGDFAEHSFNAEVVAQAKAHLEKRGFTVLLTQPLNGADVPLAKRTAEAIRAKADLILSFHADANHNKSARGHWAFYWHSCEESRKFADTWSAKLTEATGTKHRGNRAGSAGVEWPNFHMNRVPAKAGIPAVLMEHAFMTNAEDLALLQSDEFRAQSAEAAAKAVCEHYSVEWALPAPAAATTTTTTEGSVFSMPLKRGDKGDNVKLLHTYLAALGYTQWKNVENETFGDWTEDAVKRFQRDQKMTRVPAGVVDYETASAFAKVLHVFYKERLNREAK